MSRYRPSALAAALVLASTTLAGACLAGACLADGPLRTSGRSLGADSAAFARAPTLQPVSDAAADADTATVAACVDDATPCPSDADAAE